MVAITDPHISIRSDNWVYTDGVELEVEDPTSTQIFIKSCAGGQYVGQCWPGESVWIDYLNENAQNYWESLYAYDKFVGTTSIYSFWNDMNEPAVFSGDEGVMDL